MNGRPNSTLSLIPHPKLQTLRSQKGDPKGSSLDEVSMTLCCLLNCWLVFVVSLDDGMELLSSRRRGGEVDVCFGQHDLVGCCADGWPVSCHTDLQLQDIALGELS
ncbi:unnamed protein product [Ostreobium quekettii]|uniref:Uncharacterized protein n=1 Tax=Ostreobium quekettii TaxID=121088 RepID=A0A8S1ITZ7_9CHLO|nr:unnamed protein product [Ostreobium quekettii]